MLKICTKCHQNKDYSEYYVRDSLRGRLHSQCKNCYKISRSKYMTEHYKKYGDAYRLRARVRKAGIKKQRQKLLFEYLTGKNCENCGFDDIRTLDFDHIDPQNKSFGISRAINDGYSWDIILLEIEKCRILCANCHRIRTAEQQKWIKNGALAEKSGTALQKLKDGGSTRTHLH